ncbi:MAG: type 4b pilus protein PilO2 [Alphaproteobacteria bacterium]|nr:type 4b pilus protein PilO2 [Alphaproteobacteria bacterium]
MVAGVVTIGRQRYAVGLYWENSPGGGRVAQLAKEAANQQGQNADYYAVRPGNKDGRIPQFGLCSAEAGQKAGMPVLAGCLASQMPGSWAGAFRLSEGISVIIVRDDLIVPDGDLFFQDENEAHDRLVQEIGFGGLQNIYAPDAWSVPGADAIPLTLLLSDRKDIKLQQVHIPKQVKIIGGGLGLAFLLVLIGVWYWQDQVAKEEAAREAQMEAARRAREAAAYVPSILQQGAPPAPKYDRKWEAAPTTDDFVENCHKGLAMVPVAITGWHITTLRCTGTTLLIGWTRTGGISVPPPGAVINDSAGNGQQTVVLPPLKPRGDEALDDPDAVTARYLKQNWPGTLAAAPDDPPPPAPAGYTGAWPPPPPPWVKRSFTLTVPSLPGDIPELVGNLPGVIITSLAYVPKDMSGDWVVEGVIYENRK